SCCGQKSERFDFADDNQQPIGQRLYSLSRDALKQVVQLITQLTKQGQSIDLIMEVLMPT
ncbi:MAG: hypothetical protein F6K11_29670, partial [Leptolyngbya sp. SIO3F4]|nr:hypothetical protein [Leptolyngbya sp. SIO3F4]